MSAMSPTIDMTAILFHRPLHQRRPVLRLRHRGHQLTSTLCLRPPRRAGGVIADNTIAQHPAGVPLCTLVKRELIAVDINSIE